MKTVGSYSSWSTGRYCYRLVTGGQFHSSTMTKSCCEGYFARTEGGACSYLVQSFHIGWIMLDRETIAGSLAGTTMSSIP